MSSILFSIVHSVCGGENTIECVAEDHRRFAESMKFEQAITAKLRRLGYGR